MEKNNKNFGFQAQNYKLLLIGLAINILGFILMIGGATEDPNQFNADELFSMRRITLAPILIVLGYIIIIYSIMKKSNLGTKNFDKEMAKGQSANSATK